MLQGIKRFAMYSPLAASATLMFLAIALYYLFSALFGFYEVTYLKAENEAIRQNCLQKEGQK